MKQRTSTKILAVLLIGFFTLGAAASADDIKARMKSRLPVIKKLKSEGIVGEDNAGFLQFVGDKKVSADVVAADISPQLIEIAKKRLYGDEGYSDAERRGAQHALYQALLASLKMFAPTMASPVTTPR